jgi:RNA polymerase sigma-70 factor (ECF subfamily)
MPFEQAAVKTSGLDQKAFEILVRLHHRRLLAYALALSQREDAAEDLAQEAFLVAHRDLAKFDPTRDFGAWLRGIVRMKYFEWSRAHRMRSLDGATLEGLEREHELWDRASLEGREEVLRAVRSCVERLGEPLGAAVRLFYSAQEPCGRIAQKLGTSEEVVRKRLQRARESLADCVRRKIGE